MSALNSQNDDFQDNDEYETMNNHFHKFGEPNFVGNVKALADDDMDNTMSLLNLILDPTTPSWVFGH